ncbi:NADPH-dependent FMN reductase [Streptomyces sp. NPDC091387]|uniref:NADPH-dependent FMN reductase n=1 Tax=Streptomyces sp. NPDC091387 TaxID=3365998 RepID=UPI00381C9960
MILVGAAREDRFGLAAAEWLGARAPLRRQDFEVDVIDLATAWLPDLMAADPTAPLPSAVRDLSPWLAAADAFAVVTQEYRFGYPASLKNAIGWYDDEEPHGAGPLQLGGLRRLRRPQRQHRLARQPQRFPAGGRHLHARPA